MHTTELFLLRLHLMNEIIQLLQNHGIAYQENVFLRDLSYFKRGGKCGLFITPSSLNHLEEAVKILSRFECEYRVVGGTANILFCEDDYYSAIITTMNIRGINQNKNTLSVSCGESVNSFVNYCSVFGITGFEGLEGIPGTIGGAIFMNAGAYGYEISDHLISVLYLDENGNLCESDKLDCEFDYRYSKFKNGQSIILKAKFHIQKRNRKLIREEISKYHNARHVYQEWAMPTLGSLISINKDIYREVLSGTKYYLICLILKIILKNPISKFIARKNPDNKVFNYLIKDFMKNNSLSLGNINYKTIQFSDKQMNILINNGIYSDQDYIDHITLISNIVGDKFSIENEIIRGHKLKK